MLYGNHFGVLVFETQDTNLYIKEKSLGISTRYLSFLCKLLGEGFGACNEISFTFIHAF